jgi:chitodextrinase
MKITNFLQMLLSVCLCLLVAIINSPQVGAESSSILSTNISPQKSQKTESDSINIALAATPSTSYVSSWETLSAVNDGYTPASSNDNSHGEYGNWDNANSLQWVQYEWSQVFKIKSVEIYWFDDGGGVLTPTTAYIEYYKDNSWVHLVDVPCNKNKFNYASVGDSLTQKIRVSMLNSTQSTGIIEFRVWGTTASGSTDIESPTAPGAPTVTKTSDTSCILTWTASTDNIAVSGYQILKNDTAIMTVNDTIATIKGLIANKNYLFSVKAFDPSGNYSDASGVIWAYIGSDTSNSAPYSWTTYNPTLNYNFKDEFPTLSEPTQDLDDCPQVIGTQSSGWWTFKWGPNANSLVTEAAITPLLERMNKDFAYFRDSLGWPPDKRAKNGYRSAIYLYGSGLTCSDDATNTALGGWQSAITYNSESWPMVLLSYYPVYSFDPACTYSDKVTQQGGCVHEGIHSVLADLPGCKQAAWFQEGGNTWLQQEAAARQSGDYSSMGYLNGCTFLAPFMPIECYSGWLQDNSFGGPNAEGVNMTNSSGTQLCTWRNYLGGNQYGNAFPVFLGEVLGKGSVAWIWRNCPSRVLEGMAAGIGDMQIRRLIMEYRAKQALIDMKQWNDALKTLLDSYFKISIGTEWTPTWLTPTAWIATPYAKTTFDSTTEILTPEYRTTPGWSGANQIPLNVSGDTVVVNFKPLGQNMTCQLCYRATDGTPVYSIPVSSGNCSLHIDKAPANGVAFAVICNTDYIYESEDTRKAHYDYRLQLVKGISRKASIYKKWYDYNSVIVDVIDPVVDTTSTSSIYISSNQTMARIYPNPLTSNDVINLEFDNSLSSLKQVQIIDMQGKILYSCKKTDDEKLQISTENLLKQGVYLINIQTTYQMNTFKLIVK